MLHKRLFFITCLCLLLCASQETSAQAQLVLNGAEIHLSNGAKLVLGNGAPAALVRHSGHIISEGENNEIHWKIGTETGTYLVPWGLGDEGYLPLAFTKKEQVSSGTFVLSTYGTGWQNSLQLPDGVTNLTYAGQDNSGFVIDRFWQLNTKDYLRSPSLHNISFGYLDQEHTVPQNTIIEPSLQAQRWNEELLTWSDYVPQGQVDYVSNAVLLDSVPSADTYSWWTLVDASFPLPLHFLSFSVAYRQQAVKIAWQTADEVNVREFAIQRSTDLLHYTTISRQNAKGGSGGHLYTGTDLFASPGVAYYRIISYDFDEKVTYSPLKSITIPNNGAIRIFPNPVKDQKIDLYTAQIPPGNYTLTVLDSNGRILQSEVRAFSKKIETISLAHTLPPGLYILKVTGGAFLHVGKLIIE
ncbi:hypothetical protein TH63_18520 [Rufibacter radiotolerans]|uniref:Secretion system C-terminal sorting domain-containing protein n=1 Tax=Rufibacter radiotolerans TaxID=1379910 RepID=A0A0H4VTC7_9BACT|nr:T9SS type A sorting domain-containing protein [Rufibacter radiotolerans]AKQ47182.1 hypothetical protein TH63_18520 [Rufibacter radiotolerans]